MAEFGIVLELFKAFGPIGVIVFLWWKDREEKNVLKTITEKAQEQIEQYEKLTKENQSTINVNTFYSGKTLEAIRNIEKTSASQFKQTQDFTRNAEEHMRKLVRKFGPEPYPLAHKGENP